MSCITLSTLSGSLPCVAPNNETAPDQENRKEDASKAYLLWQERKEKDRLRVAKRRAARTKDQYEQEKEKHRLRARIKRARRTQEQKEIDNEKQRQHHTKNKEQYNAARRAKYATRTEEQKVMDCETSKQWRAQNQAYIKAASAKILVDKTDAIDKLKQELAKGPEAVCCVEGCNVPWWLCEINHLLPEGNMELGVQGKGRHFSGLSSVVGILKEVRRNTDLNGKRHLDLRCSIHHRDFTLKSEHRAEKHGVAKMKHDTIQKWKQEQSDKMGGCTFCGIRISKEHPLYHFDADHVQGEPKVECVSVMTNRSYSLHDVIIELAKCRLICCVCHRAWTHIQLKWRHAALAQAYLERQLLHRASVSSQSTPRY